jgi:hypothetical protein
LTTGINQSIEKYGKTFNRQFIMNAQREYERNYRRGNPTHPPLKLRGGKDKGENEWRI